MRAAKEDPSLEWRQWHLFVIAHLMQNMGLRKELLEIRVKQPYRRWAIQFLKDRSPLLDPERRLKLSRIPHTVTHVTLGEFVQTTIEFEGLAPQKVLVPDGYRVSIQRVAAPTAAGMDVLPIVSPWQDAVWKFIRLKNRDVSVGECVVGMKATKTVVSAAVNRLVRLGLLERLPRQGERYVRAVERPYTVRQITTTGKVQGECPDDSRT